MVKLTPQLVITPYPWSHRDDDIGGKSGSRWGALRVGAWCWHRKLERRQICENIRGAESKMARPDSLRVLVLVFDYSFSRG
jgi:hypothetical protein